jgi:hypothetical protein
MKKYLIVVFVLAVSLARPYAAHAAIDAIIEVIARAVEAAIVELIHKQQKDVDADKHTTKLRQYLGRLLSFREQLKKEIATYEHLVDQLKKFGNIKNYNDFMRWTNRSLYLAERVERDFSKINVKVGSKKYYPREALEIKEALENGEEDIWADEMTESERATAYRKQGLPPASYRYLKTWEGSVDAAVKESAVSKELINEENGKMEEEREHDMRLVEGKEELTETQRWQLEMRAQDRIVKQRMLFNEQMARKSDMEASRIKKEETEKLPQPMRAGSGYQSVNNNFDL